VARRHRSGEALLRLGLRSKQSMTLLLTDSRTRRSIGLNIPSGQQHHSEIIGCATARLHHADLLNSDQFFSDVPICEVTAHGSLWPVSADAGNAGSVLIASLAKASAVNLGNDSHAVPTVTAKCTRTEPRPGATVDCATASEDGKG
jgi:hypothetical protein